MYFIPSEDFPALPTDIQTALYTALECLRLAAAKFDTALDVYDREALVAWNQERRSRAPAEFAKDADDETVIEWDDISEAYCTCRFFANVIEEVTTGIPTVSERVFQRLRDHQNLSKGNPPHIEAGILAMRLAWWHLAKAYVLSREDDGAFSADHELIVCAETAVQSRMTLLEGITAEGFDLEDTFNAIVEDERAFGDAGTDAKTEAA